MAVNLTVFSSNTPRTIKKEFTLAAERNERLEQLAEIRRISENELVERALDLYFGLSDFFETEQERTDWHRLSEAALSRVWDNDQDAAYDTWRELYGVPEILSAQTGSCFGGRSILADD